MTHRILAKHFSSVLLAGTILSLASPAFAATDKDVRQMQVRLAKQEALIKAQQETLAKQTAKLDELSRKVDGQAQLTALTPSQQKDVLALSTMSSEEMTQAVGTGPAPTDATDAPAKASASEEKAPSTSIIPPAKEEKRPEINVLPDAGGVLTPKGVLMYENSAEYVNTTSNVFTFNGVQVAEVVFIGITNATTAKRQILQDSNRLRLGLTNRLEADLRVPYVYRNDKTSETNTSTNETVRTTIEGDGIGDIDAGLSYQINNGREGWPFLVANARYKANNADGPFDVDYDSEGVAEELPTGTGFHSVEGSLTMIKVTDPAVLFTNLGYVHNFGADIDKTFGNTRVVEVDPGDAINFSAGMGFSINPETSFTMGYKHSYVFATDQTNQNVSTGAQTVNESDTASVGAFMAGASYRFNPITSLNFNVEVGATREAPDVRVGIRVPIRLGSLF